MSYPFAGRSPEKLYRFLYDIFSTPRPSRHEEKMAEYVIDFAKERGLEYITDEMHNVLVRKPASPGMEDVPPVLVEGHMDMVTIKAPDSDHDFMKDPIDLQVEGNWVHGNRTTLGADNGCAVAIMLGILDDEEMIHPEIECIFTVQEELGCYGIQGFDMSLFHSRRVIGLDAGSEGVFRKGVSSKYINQYAIPVTREAAEGELWEICVYGLKGGHASVAFQVDRACAIKLAGRLAYKILEAFPEARLEQISKTVNRGVAEDCLLRILLPAKDAGALDQLLKEEEASMRSEYEESEPDLAIRAQKLPEKEARVMDEASGKRIANAIYLMPYGSFRRVIERGEEPRFYLTTRYITTEEDKVLVDNLISTDKRVNGIEYQKQIHAFFRLFGAEITKDEFSFGWDPEEDSRIRETMRQTYVELFGKEPVINVSHGGNDCVYIKERIPEFDVVTTAATYPDYHTINERLDMDSFEKVFLLVKTTISNLCREKES